MQLLRKDKRGIALEQLENALLAMREALEAYAAIAADNSDRGAVAALNEYCYRPIRTKLEELG